MIYIYTRFSINFHFLQSANVNNLLLFNVTLIFWGKIKNNTLNLRIIDMLKDINCFYKKFWCWNANQHSRKLHLVAIWSQIKTNLITITNIFVIVSSGQTHIIKLYSLIDRGYRLLVKTFGIMLHWTLFFKLTFKYLQNKKSF